MPLLVGQLIYTSFPKVGFKSLVSQQIPLEIQQSFLQNIVYQHWDTYNPPKAGYQAAYLYQFSPQQNLFGWLYNDGNDDLGRSHIPYFLSYYLNELLNIVQLETILTCLEQGPIEFRERGHLPGILDSMTIPDFCHYQSPRQGVKITSAMRKECHRQLREEKLIALFASLDAPETAIHFSPAPEGIKIDNGYALTPSMPPPVVVEAMPVSEKLISMEGIEEILWELAAKPIGIQGIAIVNLEGIPMMTPLGIEENIVQTMAAIVLDFARITQEEFNWERVESVAIRAHEGHLILTSCDAEKFLLIKAGKALTGLLEGEINRTVKKLRSKQFVRMEAG